MRGRLLRPKFITRQFLRDSPDTLFLFGDNMIELGFGGQAKEMRGEPNAVGVPTKWQPRRTPSAYFRDADLSNQMVVDRIFQAFERARLHVMAGHDVAIPADGLGTGLAELPLRAPRVHAYIESKIAELAKLAGVPHPASHA